MGFTVRWGWPHTGASVMAPVMAVLIVRWLLIASMWHGDDEWYVPPLVLHIRGVAKEGAKTKTGEQES